MLRRSDDHAEEAFSSFVEILRERATRHSGKTAFSWLEDGRAEAGRGLTYAELDSRARAIAARLQALDLVGERAILLYPPGLEFIASFFGCLYAGVLPVPSN